MAVEIAEAEDGRLFGDVENALPRTLGRPVQDPHQRGPHVDGFQDRDREAPGVWREDREREEHDDPRIGRRLVPGKAGSTGPVDDLFGQHAARLRRTLPFGRIPQRVWAHPTPDVPVGVQRAQGPVVQVAQVVPVHRVFVEHLPVAAHLVGHLAGERQRAVRQVVRPGVFVEPRDPGPEGLGGLRMRIHVHHAEMHADRRGVQRQALPRDGAETGVLVRDRAQRSGQAVGPAVIGTADRLAHVALAFHDLAAPVPADVVERAQRPGVVTQDEQLVVEDPRGKEVSGLGHVRRQARPHPAAVEQPAPLAFEPGVVHIRAPWQELPGWFEFPCHGVSPKPSSSVRTHRDAASAAATRPRATWFQAVHTS